MKIFKLDWCSMSSLFCVWKLTYQKFNPMALESVAFFFLKHYKKNAYGVQAAVLINFPEFQTSIFYSLICFELRYSRCIFCFNTNLRCNIHFFREHFCCCACLVFCTLYIAFRIFFSFSPIHNAMPFPWCTSACCLPVC